MVMNKTKKILFSCENAQEYFDLSLVMKEINKQGNAEIIYFNLSVATGVRTNQLEGDKNYQYEYDAIKSFKGNLKHLSATKKIMSPSFAPQVFTILSS